MICPVCKEDMLILEYAQTELDYCPSCQGTWMDSGELEVLMESSKKILDLSAVEHSLKSRRRCPRCRKKMWIAKFPGSNVDVDICSRDGGIWLDKGELLEIAQSQTSDDNLKKINKFLGDLFKEKTDQKEN